ncbi:MAG: hypothetical protein JWN70_3394 [Planctomycetaceae bacterium]|nr:hypothetical protein [Planctomycetaceae bacterium]
MSKIVVDLSAIITPSQNGSEHSGTLSSVIMSTFYRYLLTALFAVLMIAVPIAWSRHIMRMKIATVVQYERAERIKRGLVPDASTPVPLVVDIPPNFGPEVDTFEFIQVRISDLLIRYWYLWVMFVLGASCILFLTMRPNPNRQTELAEGANRK